MQPVTQKELSLILAKVKNNKAPGPDDIPAEAFKWLNPQNREHLIQLFNTILSTGKIPKAWKLATVVEIYKGKGSPTDPEMYRPISLLSTAYKLFARILQTRLEATVDHLIRPTQFGFRKDRSTSQPIHIVRRLIESAEAHNDTLYSLFLDWEKAFDKIHPQALLTSLKRFGINQEYIDIIEDIYDNPAFTVRSLHNQSSTHTSGSGIRQGCPLSPYLFLIVHSSIMHDVEKALITPQTPWLPTLHSLDFPLFDLAYADDTVIMCKTAATTQRILHLIQVIASQYNLKLNLGKCELLRTRPTNYAPNDVYFHSPPPANGSPPTPPTKVKVKTHAKYLGVLITPRGDMDRDLTARINRGRSGYKKLHKFWSHTDIPTGWKLQVFKMCFIPMITYGMESAALTDKQLHRLDSFQANCIRKILHIKATYYTEVLNPSHPTTTNLEVMSKVQMPTISQTIHSQQLKFLGHILRSNQSELTTQVCFTKAWVYRGGLKGDGIRNGIPKTHWLHKASDAAWKYLSSHFPSHISQFSNLSTHPSPPYLHLVLHREAQDIYFWRALAKSPTCKALASSQI